MSETRGRGRPKKVATPTKRANGAGSHYVEIKRDKEWHVVAGTIEGVGRRKVRAETEAEAWVKFAELRDKADRFDISTRTPTVGQLAERWLENYALGKSEASTKSIRESRVRTHIIDDERLARIQADKLRPDEVEAWLHRKIRSGYVAGGRQKHYSASSIRDFRLDLSQIMSWAVARRTIEWNPVAHVDPIEIAASDEKRSLTADQAGALIVECAGTARRYGAFMLACLLTGARPGEIAGLRWDAIDEEAGVIHLRQALKRRSGGAPIGLGTLKTKQTRTVRAPGVVFDALRSERKLQDEIRKEWWPTEWAGLVFLGVTGRPPSSGNIRRSLRLIAADAGLPDELADLDPYELRHTSVTLLDAAGVAVSAIVDQHGWVDDRMFWRNYRHKSDPVSGQAGAAAWEAMLGG